MDLLVAVSDWTFGELDATLRRIGRVERVIRTGDLPSLLRQRSCDVFVFDPCSARWDLSNAIVRIAWECGRPTLFSFDRSAVSVQRVLESMTIGHTEAVIREASADTTMLEERLVSDIPSPAGLVFSAMASTIVKLPRRMRVVVTALFCGGWIPNDVTEFAVGCGVSRRSLDRWIRQVGFRSAATVLATARTVRCFSVVSRGEMPDDKRLANLGYANSRTMAGEFRRLFGTSPRAMRGAPMDERLLRAVTDYLRPMPVDADQFVSAPRHALEMASESIWLADERSAR